MAWPSVLLLVFFNFVRSPGERPRPVEAAIDCSHANVHDVAGLERCLELRPDDIETMIELGDVYGQAGRWDGAEAMYRRALAVDPEDGDIRVRLGDILLRNGDAAGARREAAAALAVQPGRAHVLELIDRADAAARRR